MATTRAKPKTRDKDRDNEWAGAQLLPTGCNASMSSFQVRFALGRLAASTFRDMLRKGEFPRRDFMTKGKSRWTVETFNAYIADQKAKDAEKAKGAARGDE